MRRFNTVTYVKNLDNIVRDRLKHAQEVTKIELDQADPKDAIKAASEAVDNFLSSGKATLEDYQKLSAEIGRLEYYFSAYLQAARVWVEARYNVGRAVSVLAFDEERKLEEGK